MIGDKDGLTGFIMGDHRLRARHDAAKHGDLALMHTATTPIRYQMAIDIDEVAAGFGTQHGHQSLRRIDALKLPQKLVQRRTLIASAKQAFERMLTRIELTETADPQQGGQHQRQKALP
jgi:hypothetical protein